MVKYLVLSLSSDLGLIATERETLFSLYSWNIVWLRTVMTKPNIEVGHWEEFAALGCTRGKYPVRAMRAGLNP